ncbi:MAG: hypothetical protein HY421_00370 [Candidatus Kerfeldbacteria bacterium]|nr:hypothetical protein [Candidatus Kerfeldbacteria bacterium]
MNKISKIAAGLALASAAAFPLVAGAATPFSIEDIGGSVGLGTSDLKDTIVNIISWVLGILALLAVVFVIYGGFIWLTAGGNEDRIEKAKKIIGAAIVGLIVVMLAWAIVIFVAGTTANVTA